MVYLDINLASNYKNNSQKARVMTEDWTEKNFFCPNCGNKITNYPNNKEVADFYCESCNEDYELKAKNLKSLWKIVPDGSYESMLKRLKSLSNPNFLFLTYNNEYKIINFLIIPKFFITPENIIKAPRKLKDRWDYIMCNISLLNIPDSWKIFFLRNWDIFSKTSILEKWKKISFLREQNTERRWWLLDIMKCIEKLNKEVFTLKDIYNFEPFLKEKHPNNKHIKDKIRQQLQFLANKWYIEFVDNRWTYKKLWK